MSLFEKFLGKKPEENKAEKMKALTDYQAVSN